MAGKKAEGGGIRVNYVPGSKIFIPGAVAKTGGVVANGGTSAYSTNSTYVRIDRFNSRMPYNSGANIMMVGETLDVTAQAGSNRVRVGVTWSSSEPRVAAIDHLGRITAVSAGNTQITATSVTKTTDGRFLSDAFSLTVRDLTNQQKIFIDPGHGGRDPGAVGNGMRESNIVLEVAKKFGAIIEIAGFSVLYSRTDDSSPADRVGAANIWEADYFISIHVNAGGGTGAETFIAATKTDDRIFAQSVNDTYASDMGLRNRGVKLDTETHVRSLGVLRNTRMPAILVELAFIDSPAGNPDVNILLNRRDDMAQALANGIYKYFGEL
jgi:N-acetylmuramoyl-L-alanine amidase